jgi:glycosyltransferase involved in cell wall biosynthesis
MTIHFSTDAISALLRPGATHTLSFTTPAGQLFPVPPNPNCEVTVVIPVRDEQDTLAGTLESLAAQFDPSGDSIDHRRYEILLLINNTSDRSPLIARQIAERYPSLALHMAEIDLPEPIAHVGQARRILMDAACERLQSLGRLRGVIATTDADTIVAPTWIATTLDAVKHGADAVGGRILISPDELNAMDRSARLYHLRDVGYRFLISRVEAVIDPPPGDPWPRHFQHFGASIAVTAESYCSIGGLPVRPALEDVALYRRLVRNDATIRHSPDVRVYTSARQKGRTGFGFAMQLHQWSEMQRNGQRFFVRSASEIIDEFRTRRQVRTLWRAQQFGIRPTGNDVRSLAGQLAISSELLDSLVSESKTFGEVWQTIRDEQQETGIWPDRYPPMEIRRATQDLRYRVASIECGNQDSASRENVQPVEVLPPVTEMI